MPSFSISLRSSTSTLRSNSLPSFLACWPSQVGVQWLPGRLANSRASVTPAAMAAPRREALLHRLGVGLRWQSSVTDFGSPAPAARSAWCGGRGRSRRPAATHRASACASRRAPRRRPGDGQRACAPLALQRAEPAADRGLERPSASASPATATTTRARRRRRPADAGRARLPFFSARSPCADGVRRAASASGAPRRGIGGRRRRRGRAHRRRRSARPAQAR